MFKKIILLGCAMALFALVWAAGHDILKGQPKAWMEWTVVLAGGALAGRILFLKWVNLSHHQRVDFPLNRQ